MLTTNTFKDAARVHTAVTASYEKRLLIWMANRMPRLINSDQLTALALVAQIIAGVGYALSSQDLRALPIVNICLFLNWLGDSLDGTLARVRNQQRPRYGFYVDHIVDTFGALALMLGLACSGFLHWQIGVAMLLCFYVLSIESYLATYTVGRFHISHGYFGPTEIRILLVIGNLVLPWCKYVDIGGRHLLLFDIGGAVAIIGMSLMAVTAVTRNVLALYRAEPLP